jgi:hypothetical protein
MGGAFRAVRLGGVSPSRRVVRVVGDCHQLESLHGSRKLTI